jgi:hypothetical protein
MVEFSRRSCGVAVARSDVPKEPPAGGELTPTVDRGEYEPVDFEEDEDTRRSTTLDVPGIPEPVFVIGKSLLIFLVIIAILVLIVLLTK